jgi:hypothetical protein
MFVILDPWRWVSHSDPWLLSSHFKTTEEKGEIFVNVPYGEEKE